MSAQSTPTGTGNQRQGTGNRGVTSKPPKPEPADLWTYLKVVVVGLGLILVLCGFELAFGKAGSSPAVASAAAVLALVSALAVGIERILEGFWTVVDNLAANPSLFFSSDAKRFQHFAQQLNDVVKAPLDDLSKGLQSADQLASKVQKELPGVQSKIGTLLDSVGSVATSQDPQAWRDGLPAIRKGLVEVHAALGSAEDQAALQGGIAGLDALSGWVSSLTGNPGRRLLSLIAASLMGLGASWVLGLDVIHAALGTAGAAAVSALPWGMVATGLVIGLGSNPTHELVKGLQAYKQSKV